MPGTLSGGLSRVTIVAPGTRMDLALPSDLPLADLLPALLFHAGGHLADDGAGHGGWALARMGGPPLDAGRTPAQLEIRDGEILFLTPRTATMPEVVFDDVVDAVATATLERPGRWEVATTRRFATGWAAAALLGGGFAVLLAGPPHLPAAAVGLGLALTLLLTASVAARRHPRSGTLLGLVGLVYGAIGGLLLLAGERPVSGLAAPDVLLAGSLVLVLAATATLVVAGHPQVFLGAMVVGLAIAVGAAISIVSGASPAVPAAIVGTAALATFPALPMLSYRLAHLPVPTIPADRDDLRAETGQVDGRRMLLLSDRADEFHTSLVGAAALLVAGAAGVATLAAGWPGWIFAAVLGGLLLLRARPYRGWPARLLVLLAGSLALAGVAVAGFGAGSLAIRLGLVVGGLLAATAISLSFGLGLAGRRISPVWGRLLDLAEVAMIVSVVPLAAWVTGLFGWIATIRN